MATKQDVSALQNSVSQLTGEQQAGARALAENYMKQGKTAVEATQAALSTYSTPQSSANTAETNFNAPNSSVSTPYATTIQPTTPKPQETQINGGVIAPITPTPTPTTPETSATNVYPAPLPAVTTPKATTTPTTGKETEKIVEPEVRREQIRTNLQEGMKNAPQLFKDRATFDAAYGYAGADTDKRAIMDALWNSRTPTSEEDIYNSLKT